MKTILYLTDLYYIAQGRNYYEEDLYLTERLKEHFNILIGHPHQAMAYLDVADLVVFRNTGSVLHYESYFKQFLEKIAAENILTFNSFDGKADIKGKQYLLDLSAANYPVIPTIDHLENLANLGSSEKYVVKLKNGADSIGMEFLNKEELLAEATQGKLIQPYIDFEYEVSFYYLNEQFQYALYAPDKDRRWELTEYEALPEDIAFANQFIQWNALQHGITRVDACRCTDGRLLLVELEDLNPFLSIDVLSEAKREQFIKNWIACLEELG